MTLLASYSDVASLQKLLSSLLELCPHRQLPVNNTNINKHVHMVCELNWDRIGALSYRYVQKGPMRQCEELTLVCVINWLYKKYKHLTTGWVLLMKNRITLQVTSLVYKPSINYKTSINMCSIFVQKTERTIPIS